MDYGRPGYRGGERAYHHGSNSLSTLERARQRAPADVHFSHGLRRTHSTGPGFTATSPTAVHSSNSNPFRSSTATGGAMRRSMLGQYHPPTPATTHYDGGIATHSSAAERDLERYIGILERDLEAMRTELEAATARANNPETLQQLREVSDDLKAERQARADFERQVASLQINMNHLEQLQQDYAKLNDEHRHQQGAAMQLERDVDEATRRAAAAEERESRLLSDLQAARDDLRESENNAKMARAELATATRQLAHEKETAKIEHSRIRGSLEMEVASLKQRLDTKDQEVQTRNKTIESLQERVSQMATAQREAIANKDKTHAELRSKIQDLEGSLRAANKENEMQAKTLHHHEENYKSLTARRDEVHELLTQHQAQVKELQGTIDNLTSTVQEKESEIESLETQIGSFERQVETLTTLREDADERNEKYVEMYTELGKILSASDTQVKVGMVSSKARELVEQVHTLEKELEEAKAETSVQARETATKDSAIERLEGIIERKEADRERLDADLSDLREELLGRTKELREATLTQESLVRETRLQEEQIARLEGLLDEKDKQIEHLKEKLDDTNNTNEDTFATTKRKYERLEERRDRELARLQEDLDYHKAKNRNDAVYADMFVRLGRLLQVDPDVTAAEHAENVHSAVLRLKEKTEEAELEAMQATQQLRQHQKTADRHRGNYLSASHQNGLGTSFMGHSFHATLHERPATSGGWGGHTVSAETLQAAEEKHENFRHTVARMVHCSRAYDDDAVLDALGDFVQRRESEGDDSEFGSRGKRKLRRDPAQHGSRSLHSPSRGRRTQSRDKHHASHRSRSPSRRKEAHGREEAESEKLRKKLDAALKTIESQDMWIESLNKSNQQQQAYTQLSSSAQEELAELRTEVVRLRTAALTMPMSSEPLSGVGSADVLAFKNAIAELERRLQKHIEFRSKVVRALGISAVSASDHEILSKIKDLRARTKQARR